MTIPSRLYKYQAYTSYALESLIRRKIWITDPKSFNDPFDCQLDVEDVNTFEKLEAVLQAYNRMVNKALPFRQEITFNMRQEADQSPEEYADRIRNQSRIYLPHLLTVGVYSLARAKDDLIMWAHYANHHKGFVVGFDTAGLREGPFIQVVKVEYVDKKEEVPLAEITEPSDTPTYLRTIASRKGCRWREEQEWRLVFPWPHVGRLIDMPMPPVEMIFGHRMEAPHRETLHHLVRANFPDVEFFTAEPSVSQFRLEIRPYSVA